MRLLGDAAATYLMTLDAVSKADEPAGWANLRFNLGLALRDWAAASAGDIKLPLLVAATDAVRDYLSIRTAATSSESVAKAKELLAELETKIEQLGNPRAPR